MYDLFIFSSAEFKNIKGCILDSHTLRVVQESKGTSRFPLLTETQLRKFIEEKTDTKIDIDYSFHTGYSFRLYPKVGNLKSEFFDIDHDLLQAYWQVAVQIAKESMKNE